MQSIKDFTDAELNERIIILYNLLDIYEYGTGDYNCTESELKVALRERHRRKDGK